MNERFNRRAEEFWHSHVYESHDGAESEGLEGVLESRTVELAHDLVEMRQRHGVDDEPTLLPMDNPDFMREFNRRVLDIVRSRDQVNSIESDNFPPGRAAAKDGPTE